MRAFLIKSVILVFLLKLLKVESLNILAIFPYQGKSHFVVSEALLKTLAEKGHNVTVISYFPQNKSIPNYIDISLTNKDKKYENWVEVSEPSYIKLFMVTVFLVVTGTNNCKVLLSDKNVQKLWKSEIKFDVALVEQFNSDCALGLAYKFGAPVVGFSSHTLMPYHYNRLGVPNNPSYTPFQLLNGGSKPSMIQRIERTIFMIYFQYVLRVVIQTVNQYTLSQYFENIPPLEELGKKIKFMLINEHFTLFAPTILPSNVKQIGGLHITEAKPLPLDIEKFINESEHGVIYICFGTTINSISTPPEKLDIILRTLSKLKQRIIWKWDGDTLPDQKGKIYTSKWLPQNDILAHPKVVAMFYHCGLLGLTEALYHGVPVVGMPIFGDQPRNAAALEESGLGVQIQLSELNDDILLEKFKTVLDPAFKENLKQLSNMWRDRPIDAKEEAIYWIEYAARYPNSTFRTAYADVPLYQFLCLDIIFVFIIIFVAVVLVIKSTLKFCRKRCTRKNTFNKLKSKRH